MSGMWDWTTNTFLLLLRFIAALLVFEVAVGPLTEPTGGEGAGHRGEVPSSGEHRGIVFSRRRPRSPRVHARVALTPGVGVAGVDSFPKF